MEVGGAAAAVAVATKVARPQPCGLLNNMYLISRPVPVSLSPIDSTILHVLQIASAR